MPTVFVARRPIAVDGSLRIMSDKSLIERKEKPMQWSKLKKSIEYFFADSVKDRVELRSTRYHKSHDHEGRGYIVVDNEEIISFCSITAWRQERELLRSLVEISGNPDHRNPVQRDGYWQTVDQTMDILNKQGIYTQYKFYDSLNEYLSISIDDAVESNNLIIRSIAILDRRLGKRRIPQYRIAYTDHPALKKLFEFRCMAEEIRIPSTHPTIQPKLFARGATR